MTVMGKDMRGSFKAIELGTAAGKGIQASVPSGNLRGSSSLVTSFSVSQGENFSVAQCLNGGVYLYTFGHDPQRSHFSVGITSFLAQCDGSIGSAVDDAIKLYNSNRVSQAKQKGTLTIGTGTCRGYLVGQDISVVDAELNIVSATYTFIALNAQGE